MTRIFLYSLPLLLLTACGGDPAGKTTTKLDAVEVQPGTISDSMIILDDAASDGTAVDNSIPGDDTKKDAAKTDETAPAADNAAEVSSGDADAPDGAQTKAPQTKAPAAPGDTTAKKGP